MSRGGIDSGILYRAGIITIQENLLQPDWFTFIALPLPKNSQPGTERERIPEILRTEGINNAQLAEQVRKSLAEEIKKIEAKGLKWEWVTVERPKKGTTSEVEKWFHDHHCREGEGISFIRVKPKETNTTPPQLSK